MMDIRSRKELTKVIDSLGLKHGVEIGVNTGEFSAHLLEQSALDVLHSIDGWTTDTGQTMSVFRKWATSKGEVETAYEMAQQRLAAFKDRSHIIRALSFDAVGDFADGSLDFIYLDGSHRFSGVSLDLMQWWPKLREGGVLAGHDYWKCYRCEVMDAVNGFVVEHKQVLHLTTDDKNRLGGLKYPPSFWLVKELRTRRKYNKDLSQALPRLLADKERLAGYGVEVVLPYQYM
jgi:hypothetical protein